MNHGPKDKFYIKKTRELDIVELEKCKTSLLPFGLSPSKILAYYNCKISFWANYLYKQIKFTETPQTIRGNKIHEELENYLNTGNKNTVQIDEVLPEYYYHIPTKIRNAPNTLYYAEKDAMFGFTDIGLTEVHTLKNFWDKHQGKPYFLTGGVDVLAITGDNAIVVDYKTGKEPYQQNNDNDSIKKSVLTYEMQLLIYAVYVFTLNSNIKKVKTILLYLTSNSKKELVYNREQLDDMRKIIQIACVDIIKEYSSIKEREQQHISLDRTFLEEYSTGQFDKSLQTTPLCKFCDYKDRCLLYSKK